ncbi:MAG: serine/threonine protein phosphatase, partial [Dinoroseobacter sp.]|nr:serine/threonine protein phosphatase [Dinoroseobacter sp.]
MRGILMRLFGGTEPSERNPSQQLHLSELPPLTYVIGDIHGMSDLYRKLERQIAAEADGQPCLIVCVGDVVDRGQDS